MHPTKYLNLSENLIDQPITYNKDAIVNMMQNSADNILRLLKTASEQNTIYEAHTFINAAESPVVLIKDISMQALNEIFPNHKIITYVLITIIVIIIAIIIVFTIRIILKRKQHKIGKPAVK